MMPARQLEARPRIANPRSAKAAAQTRIVRTSRAKYAGLIRVGAVVGTVLATLLGYVWLTSNVTSMTYAVASAHQRRETLVEANNRLDDQLAIARSDERLARLAARLNMHEPQRLSVIVAPARRTVAQRASFPVFSTIAGWFGGSHAAPQER